MFIFLFFPVLLPPQCRKYIVLKEPSRNISYGYGRNNDQDRSKTKITGSSNQWYRFQAPAGTKMPDDSPSLNGNKCGTWFPGWLKGGHPTKAGQVVSRTVCFSARGQECYTPSILSKSVKVTHCGSYFVYQLPRTSNRYNWSTMRYCATN